MKSMSSTGARPIRLWPGVVLVIAQWFLWLVLPVIAPGEVMIASLGGLGAGAAVVLWWLLFSRAPWVERIGAVLLMVAATAATQPFLDASVLTAIGGMLFYLYIIPVLSVALVAGVAIGRRYSTGTRRVVIAAAIVIASAGWLLVRLDGISVGRAQLSWRWSETAEARLLAQAKDVPPAPVAVGGTAGLKPRGYEGEEGQARGTASTPVAAGLQARGSERELGVEWPGFRGGQRDGVVRAGSINTNWSKAPPAAMWRRSIGPGWSSFAVSGELVYTQEQRGEEEIVAAYQLQTGKPVWMHREAARFWEANAGAGPRATPAVHNGRVYALGATGILNALDAATGARMWSRNAAKDAAQETPQWGFAGSPLIHNDLVIAAVSGRLAAFDIATGAPRWLGPEHRDSYSSPHRATIGGVPQILLLTADGIVSVLPATGELVWEYAWRGGNASVQPAVTSDGDVLISNVDGPGGIGMRRLHVDKSSAGWKVSELWTTNGLKPYFNDFVVHNGHAYGFDGAILACIDLADGKRKWKGGRYGDGQLVLLPEQDVLLVLSEDGELALVSATNGKFSEIGRAAGISGKTWNHPVLAGDVLLVRNGEEMAAFRVARK
jgi:outer membrane protein assembly factor BamB